MLRARQASPSLHLILTNSPICDRHTGKAKSDEDTPSQRLDAERVSATLREVRQNAIEYEPNEHPPYQNYETYLTLYLPALLNSHPKPTLKLWVDWRFVIHTTPFC
ncbi:MAG: hypothetical protein M3247_08745 [Thermoproteota archaeon]|nr:hypothetical protein [Thermoproteota archaeon]